ncbi:guanine deaminase [Clostridium culturomicium]|uniref:guanine deaminase n=1 Tax=Clostridium culturomicium TaxID=1499683 RepID=UPI00058F6BC8|nr:guanine deaminase [Clostridium culturomicium]
MRGLKGNIIFTKDFGKYEIFKDSYILIEDGKVKGIFDKLPEEYNQVEVKDYGDKLIIPGLVDIHLHGPQFPNIGLGLDKELMPWLETYTFPEERKYSDLEYAKKVYRKLVLELWKNGTMRSVIFASIHLEGTKLLMDVINEAGLGAYVGKVNMDRNCPDFICEDTDKSLEDTEKLLKDYGSRYERVKPIITPRFVPTCSTKLLKGLGELSRKYKVPVQSHLSENKGEIEFVKELHPEARNYASVYEAAGLLGEQPTIMAHCVLLEEEEIELLSKNKVFIAHSPNSNSNLASGIAPIRKLLKAGIPIGLASDISGGHSLSMCSVMIEAGQVSNMKWLESGKTEAPLTTPELFYLATKGSGAFFGKVGSFEEGFEFDALVIDDSDLTVLKEISLEERLQKFIYTGSWENIIERYVSGELIKEPKI